MPRHREYEVWLEVDGKRLKEYGSVVDGPTISCWIPSESGKVVRIHWKDLHNPHEISSRLFFKADGMKVDSCVIANATSYVWRGIYVDGSIVKPLVFSPLTASDDGRVTTHDARSRQELGVLAVEVYQIRITERRTGWQAPRTPYVSDNPWAKEEASTQGHRITTGPEIQLNPGRKYTYSHEPYDKSHPGPIAIFKFQYRPEAFLRAQGLIKRATTRIPVMAGAGLEISCFIERLEYLRMNHAEILRHQDEILTKKSGRDPATLLESLRFWQSRLQETQNQLDELVRDMRELGGRANKMG